MFNFERVDLKSNGISDEVVKISVVYLKDFLLYEAVKINLSEFLDWVELKSYRVSDGVVKISVAYLKDFLLYEAV